MSVELTAEAILDLPTALGEGPVWHPTRNALLWVDIMGAAVHLFDPASGEDRALPTPSHVGTVVPRADGHAVVALVDGLHALDLDTGACERIAAIEDDQPGNRANDGKCDPAGRLWYGSMNYDHTSKSGALYRYDERGVHRQRTGVTISNGLGWSPDGRTMYYIDTPTHRCEAMPYDPASGEAGEPTPCITTFAEGGHPDGLCVDTDGMVWIALWGASRVERYDPASGERLAIVHTPGAVKSSACALVGDQLYITTAGGEERPTHGELAGSLYRCTVDVEGLPPGVFPA